LAALAIFGSSAAPAFAEPVAAAAPPSREAFVANILASGTPDTLDQKFENINAILNIEQAALREGIRFEMESQAATPEQKAWAEKKRQEAVTYRFSEIAFTGNEKLSTKDLNRVAKPYLNRDLAWNGIRDLVADVEKLYAKKGYYAAVVSMPAPEEKTEKLALNISEGKFGKVEVTGNKWVSTPTIQRYFKNIRPSQVLDYNTVQNDLNRLNKNKDIQATAAPKQGQTPGTTDLSVQVKDRHPFHLTGHANNFGTDATGRSRYGLGFEHTNLLGLTDTLTVGGQTSEDAWDAGVDYNLPVNRWGTRVGGGYKHLYDEVGADYRVYDVRGDADIYGVYVTHPVYAQPDFEATASVGFDWKSAENKNFPNGTRKDEIRAVNTGVRLESNDAYGTTVSPHSLNFGLDSFGASEEGDRNVTGFETGGEFFVYRGALVRKHKIIEGISLLARARGQIAADELAPLEQLRLGGPFSVRGYQDAEFLADSGVDGTLELHFSPDIFPKTWTLPFSNELLNRAVEWIAFVDGGLGTGTDPFIGDKQSRNLMGAGGGLRLHLYDKVYARLEWAAPLDGDRPQNEETSSFYFGISAELF
jgi:hemolysin activation/secretion protein